MGLSATTAPDAVVGTPGYMSPEQLRGLEELDGRTDLWSLGVVLYRMTARRKPFKGKTAADVNAAIIGSEPDPLSTPARPVPEELERIVSKGLAKDRDRRYQTAEEMIADLRRLHAQLELKTAGRLDDAPGAGGAGGRARRSWKRPALVAAALLVAAAVGMFVYRYWTRNELIAASSIAVLPFADESAGPDAGFLGDGLTESLINDLSRFSNLRVIARSSAFRYKGRPADPRRIGKELNVQVLLTGRIERHGDVLTVSVELMDVRNDRHLGGAQHTLKQSDLLSWLWTGSTRHTSTARRI